MPISITPMNPVVATNSSMSFTVSGYTGTASWSISPSSPLSFSSTTPPGGKSATGATHTVSTGSAAGFSNQSFTVTDSGGSGGSLTCNIFVMPSDYANRYNVFYMGTDGYVYLLSQPTSSAAASLYKLNGIPDMISAQLSYAVEPYELDDSGYPSTYVMCYLLDSSNMDPGLVARVARR